MGNPTQTPDRSRARERPSHRQRLKTRSHDRRTERHCTHGEKYLSVEVSCPACGATISFKIGSSIVVVCEYCNSVIARGDRDIEDLGKVADLADTGSPLDLGLKGVYQGVPFELTGRAQLGHEAGGVWDEWYAAFREGKWGWLAKAQGRSYMTFQQARPDQGLMTLPTYEYVHLGQPVAAL